MYWKYRDDTWPVQTEPGYDWNDTIFTFLPNALWFHSISYWFFNSKFVWICVTLPLFKKKNPLRNGYFFSSFRESQPETLINPRFLTIESTGRVYWYQRIKLLTPCTAEPDTPGNLSCPITFGSMQFPSSELDLNEIECDYRANNTRFNVTSVYKDEEEEDLPGVPFAISTMTIGSCVVNLTIDTEARKKEQEAYNKYSAQKSSMNSSSVSDIASVLVTVMLSLTSMLKM